MILSRHYDCFYLLQWQIEILNIWYCKATKPNEYIQHLIMHRRMGSMGLEDEQVSPSRKGVKRIEWEIATSVSFVVEVSVILHAYSPVEVRMRILACHDRIVFRRTKEVRLEIAHCRIPQIIHLECFA